MDKNYQGVVDDPRSEEQKSLDYDYSELAKGDVPLNWIEYNEKNLKTYEIQNQDGSLSCVGQATAKILAMHEVKEGKGYTRLCPKFIYDFRQNYPAGGMFMQDALSIACKYGSCPEKDLPCDSKGETFMNDKSLITEELKTKAYPFRAKYYFEITGGIDDIAEVMEQGYGVLLWFRFDYDEWLDVPVLHADSKLQCSHGVAGVDYCLYNGEKALVIEDSWGPGYGKGGRRIITETFLKARKLYAGYITSLQNFVFTQTLRYGSRGLEVKKLQEVLGLTQDGIFGLKTKMAVIKYQKEHQLSADGIVGPITRQSLNHPQ